MATVYEAEDLRHHRTVAIKVLRPELGAVIGPERFLKEIEFTANLHHPHILGLIDSGAIEGQLFYVMPFMEGESLRARLDRERQLPVGDAVRIAAEVAAALDYAHRQGVVHRDIKPENILLHDNHAMVADFGIALAVSEAAGQRLTSTGLSLGTPHYMSPEQAAGDGLVDGRTDTYSLGCAVYEMLTGEPPFIGRTAHSVLTAVMTTEPAPVRNTRPTVPEYLDAAVATALEKLPADRFQSAGEFAEALVGPTARTSQRIASSLRTTSTRAGSLRLAAMGVSALVAGVLIGGLIGGSGDTEPDDAVRHFDLLLPGETPVALTGPGPLGFWQPAVALDPDGDQLVYVAPSGATTALAIRPLDRDTASVLPGTEGAYHPFFSPDGDWIGFFVGNELRKIPVAGGSPVTLTTVDRPSGAAWPEPDEIMLFQQAGFEMRRIPAAGGEGESFVLPAQFASPDVLPGGKAVLGHMGSGQLGVLTLADTILRAVTRRGVIPLDSVRLGDLLIGASPKFVTSGHVVFGGEDGQLMALPFDGEALETRGGPVPMVSGLRIEEGFGFAQYDIGPDGTLVYIPGRSQLFGHIAFVGRDGVLDTLPLPRGQYTQLRMSPDGRPAANRFLEARLYRFATASWETVTGPMGSYMVTSPDGQDVAYSDFRTGELFYRSLRDSDTHTPIPGQGFAASYSPDGQWLAWGGTNGGVLVSPMPPTGATYTVTDRGQQPLWTADGSRLLYRDGRRFYEATVDGRGGPAAFQSGRPRLIAEGSFLRTLGWTHTIGRDGRLAALISAPRRRHA